MCTHSFYVYMYYTIRAAFYYPSPLLQPNIPTVSYGVISLQPRAVISIFSSPYFSVLQFSLSSPNAYQTIFPTCKHLYIIVYNNIFHSELTARRFLPPSFSCALGNTVEPNISNIYKKKNNPVALLVFVRL